MSLYALIDAFRRLGAPDIKNDDFYDRLSRRYSFFLLGASFLIVASSQFIGSPINCYTQNVPGSHTSYVNWVCWISPNYYTPFEQPLPNRDEKPKHEIFYYQWVPFILLSMMFFFYLPGFIWRHFNKACGINTKMIGQMVSKMDQLNGDKRENAVRALAKHIDKALAYHREYEHGMIFNLIQRFGSLCCCRFGRHSGSYLVFTYIVVKILYIANAVGQLFLLRTYLGFDFHLLGLKTIQRWWAGEGFFVPESFPRVTMCEFNIRALGDNIQPFDVQCLLPINIYNEKIFLVIWFWLCFVTVASVYGLLKWFYYLTFAARSNFVARFLKANEIRYSSSTSLSSTELSSSLDAIPNKRLEEFIETYCRQDGILLLRLIKKNTNNVIAGEVICALWDQWKVLPHIQYHSSSDSENGGRLMGLGVKSSMKILGGTGEVTEKLLSSV